MKKIVTAVAIVLAIGALAEAGLNYGVIFSGGVDRYNNHDRYYEETLRMWNIMTGTLAYDEVYVLFGDGIDSAIDRSSGVSSDWHMITAAGGNIEAATYSNLQNRLLGLQTLITPDDCFHFWSFDHGYGSSSAPDSGGLCSWNPSWTTQADYAIPDDVFASWVNPIDSYAQSFAFGQCFAGDMVNDLNILPGENRFAAWAADWYESSWGQGWIDAWADGLEAGLRMTNELGEYALWNDPYGPGGTGWEHPGWIGADFHIITNEPFTEPIPAPGAILLGSIGVGFVSWLRRRRTL